MEEELSGKLVNFIAEIGLNHMGDEKIALALVRKASLSRPWGISIQIAEESYYDYSKPWKRKLDLKFYKKTKKFLMKKNIKFGLGIYDISAIKSVSDIKIDFWKIISTKFYNNELIKTALKTKKPVFLSTGFASMKDIKKKSDKFNNVNFVHTALDKKISQNLNAIKSIRKVTKKNQIAYGLHSDDKNTVLMAFALNANPIFFYIRPDGNKKYPDHEHAIPIGKLKTQLKYWISCIKNLGDGKKNNLKVPKWVLE